MKLKRNFSHGFYKDNMAFKKFDDKNFKRIILKMILYPTP